MTRKPDKTKRAAEDLAKSIQDQILARKKKKIEEKARPFASLGNKSWCERRNEELEELKQSQWYLPKIEWKLNSNDTHLILYALGVDNDNKLYHEKMEMFTKREVNKLITELQCFEEQMKDG